VRRADFVCEWGQGAVEGVDVVGEGGEGYGVGGDWFAICVGGLVVVQYILGRTSPTYVVL
jgi:hypothetical protein